MENTIYVIKLILLFFIFMYALSIAINLADSKQSRLPWKKVFITTTRITLSMALVCFFVGAIGYALFK